nr:hypothetical protein CFP56_74966 [Quercus suber]
MKAILIVCLFLASSFFIASSNAARDIPIRGRCNPYVRECYNDPPYQMPHAPPLILPAPPLNPPAPPHRRIDPPFYKPPCTPSVYRRGCPP